MKTFFKYGLFIFALAISQLSWGKSCLPGDEAFGNNQCLPKCRGGYSVQGLWTCLKNCPSGSVQEAVWRCKNTKTKAVSISDTYTRKLYPAE